MYNLFSNSDTALSPLPDYVRTFLEDDDEDSNLFQLPPIQRNSVWNVAQIERLWDSLLRGYPIGSFLVSCRKESDKARDFKTGKQREATSPGYFLLDGQQRTRALLLGFQPNEDARLWIDLDPKLDFGNIDLNDRKFLLRVISNYQPWGMSDRNPSEKLSQHEKAAGRKKLNLENTHYDYQLKINRNITGPNNDLAPWPLRSTLPVPLDGLINLCGGTSGTFIEPSWQSVLQLLPKQIEVINRYKEPTPHFEELIFSLKKIIHTNGSDSKTRTVVLLLQDQHTTSFQHASTQDDIEVLFRRINSGGTVLQGEEMAYSLLKQSWDGAYDMVSKIVRNRKVGYLLSATGIVMTATRLARYLLDKKDDPNPGVSAFRRWIGAEDDEGSFLKTMKSLLESDETTKSKFQSTLEEFCQLCLYREEQEEDIGIPRKLLLSIKPAVYQPVITWIYENVHNSSILDKSRKNIIRYLIYSFLAVDFPVKASKVALETIRKIKGSTFPDQSIYEKLLAEELVKAIPGVEEFSAPFNSPVDGFFRHHNDVFAIHNDVYNAFRQVFWQKKEILLWHQRSYVSKWFKGYNPMSNDAFDTPYDWDHIVPYSHLITSGAMPEIDTKDQDLKNKFNWNRHPYINSLGNLRLWPSWANRSDNNCCHTYKLRMEDAKWETDVVAKELMLGTAEEFLVASSINLYDFDLWYDAGGEIRSWPEERRKAWQTAVEKRVCFLYKEIYDKLDFQSLKENGTK